MAGIGSFPEDDTRPGSSHRASDIIQARDEVFSIRNDKGPTVIILADGTMEFGPNYNPSEAARTFWRAVLSCYPLTLRSDADIIEKCAWVAENLEIKIHWQGDPPTIGDAQRLIAAEIRKLKENK